MSRICWKGRARISGLIRNSGAKVKTEKMKITAHDGVHLAGSAFVPVCSVYEARAATMGKAQLLTIEGAFINGLGIYYE